MAIPEELGRKEVFAWKVLKKKRVSSAFWVFSLLVGKDEAQHAGFQYWLVCTTTRRPRV
jgi:hypothetical protein